MARHWITGRIMMWIGSLPTLTLIAAVAVFVAAADQEETVDAQLTISSPAFANGQPIPERHTADGEDTSPELAISGTPEGTVSFALIMDDPDAPRGTWVHWVVWSIPSTAASLPEGGLPAGAVEGRNSWGRSGYRGPAPPSGTHRYFFKLYALDSDLDLPATTDKNGLLHAMEGRVLARAQVMGTYSR
jgi:Raf kinase inhibitor-like YbhB/YbcL family protein